MCVCVSQSVMGVNIKEMNVTAKKKKTDGGNGLHLVTTALKTQGWFSS